MAADQRVSDKVCRSPTETAGKGGEWGFLQNKVNRASKVAIPLDVYLNHPSLAQQSYNNGSIIYATPADYFSGKVPANLRLGIEFIVLYTSDAQLVATPPATGWKIFELVDANGTVVDTWKNALNWRGDYYVRIKRGKQWDYGGGVAKAIGIRQDEYCSRIDQCFIVGQMSYLAWSLPGTRAKFGVSTIPQYIIDFLDSHGMLDINHMQRVGMINSRGIAQCPFCHEELSFQELINQAPQQIGRQLASSNATALHLMHIDPLKMGLFNHKPYNLALGHAKCNHAQGEDSISKSVDFLFSRRLNDALSSVGLPTNLQTKIRALVLS